MEIPSLVYSRGEFQDNSTTSYLTKACCLHLIASLLSPNTTIPPPLVCTLNGHNFKKDVQFDHINIALKAPPNLEENMHT